MKDKQIDGGGITGNILLVSNYPSDTAYAWWLMESFWLILAKMHREAGFEAFLAYPKLVGAKKEVLNQNLTVLELDVLNGSRNELQKFLKLNEVRSVYLTDLPYFSFFNAWLRSCGVSKIISHDHTPGDRPPVVGLKGLVKSLRNRLSWFTCDAVFAISPLMKERSELNARIPSEKVLLVQNGIPLICAETVSKDTRSSLGINESASVVVSTGRAHPYKRPEFIMRAAAKFIESNPNENIVFLVIGDGPCFSELKSLHERLHLGDKLRLLGFRSDVKDILAASDLAVHAALGEGFSLSIVEYMAAGLPVLVPDIPSVQQAITHDYNGYVYSKDSVDSLVEQLQSLVLDSTKRLRMGLCAQKTVKEEYTLDRCHKEFKVAVSSVLG